MDGQTDGQTDVGQINLIGGLVTLTMTPIFWKGKFFLENWVE